MVVAVPPAPIAAFGNQHLFERPLAIGGWHFMSRGLEHLPRLAQLAPGALVVCMADPDEEVAVDPRSGKDARQRAGRLGGGFGHRHRPELRMVRQPAVERPEERAAAAFKM